MCAFIREPSERCGALNALSAELQEASRRMAALLLEEEAQARKETQADQADTAKARIGQGDAAKGKKGKSNKKRT